MTPPEASWRFSTRRSPTCVRWKVLRGSGDRCDARGFVVGSGLVDRDASGAPEPVRPERPDSHPSAVRRS